MKNFIPFLKTGKVIVFNRLYTVRKMPCTADEIREKLTTELNATHLEIVDESCGCGEKFACVIVSEKFANKPLLQRHRLVNTTLSEQLKKVHAFSQKTYTPEQWQKEQEKDKQTQ